MDLNFDGFSRLDQPLERKRRFNDVPEDDADDPAHRSCSSTWCRSKVLLSELRNMSESELNKSLKGYYASLSLVNVLVLGAAGLSPMIPMNSRSIWRGSGHMEGAKFGLECLKASVCYVASVGLIHSGAMMSVITTIPVIHTKDFVSMCGPFLIREMPKFVKKCLHTSLAVYLTFRLTFTLPARCAEDDQTMTARMCHVIKYTPYVLSIATILFASLMFYVLVKLDRGVKKLYDMIENNLHEEYAQELRKSEYLKKILEYDTADLDDFITAYGRLFQEAKVAVDQIENMDYRKFIAIGLPVGIAMLLANPPEDQSLLNSFVEELTQEGYNEEVKNYARHFKKAKVDVKQIQELDYSKLREVGLPVGAAMRLERFNESQKKND